MYKQELGYRIGHTIGIRSSNGKIKNGIEVRLVSEQADKIWIT